MNKCWQIKKLSEVCTVITGQSPEGRYYNTVGDGLPFYQGKKEFTEKYIGMPTTWTTRVTKEALRDDILMSVRAPVGPINFSTEKICIGRGLAAIRTNKLIDKEFLFNFLLKHESEIIGNSGAVFNSINKAQIENILIPIPSIAEQQRIVTILDKAFAAIAKAKENAEKNLQNARELFESYLQSIFENQGKDWEKKSLEELGVITSSKRIYKKEYAKAGIPFYRIKEIKELAHDKNVTFELYISKHRYREIKDTFGVPVEGDLLMTAVGTIGEVYVVKKDEEFYFKDGNVLWFKNFNSVDSYFLKFVLMAFIKKIKKMSKGSTYSALTIEKIEKHCVFIPKSITEQKSIVTRLDALSTKTQKLETIYKKKLADLEELKKSILKKAFAGEL